MNTERYICLKCHEIVTTENDLEGAQHYRSLFGCGGKFALIPHPVEPLPPPSLVTALPQEAAERKKVPVASGVLDYFPDAIAAVANVSWHGNNQHNPGQPLHWSREKSNDHSDCLMRHFLQRGTKDSDGLRHTAKLAWRALAMLQLELEK